jgi:hypothetical protein
MTHLSKVFCYISMFRHAGHQVGRKVGDMLEVLTYAALASDEQLRLRLQIEPRLYGFSDAGHKVEFALLSEPTAQLRKGGEITDPSNLIGFIECKKVGVEQTVNTGFKKKYAAQDYKFSAGDILRTTLSKAGAPIKYALEVHFLTLPANKLGIRVLVSTGGALAIVQEDVEILSVDESMHLQKCKILEIQTVISGVAKVLLNDCLSGPQTPEKAKQSAFVALDVRKLRFNMFDKREHERELVSVLVLTEFSHWEQKSQNVVKTCLDKVLIVSDDIIIEAFQKFERSFGPVFYDFISKDNFEFNPLVAEIALEIINRHQGYIFKDLDDGQMKKFHLEDGGLVLVTEAEYLERQNLE